MMVLAVPAFCLSALMALLTANPCGAFGDACDSSGGAGAGFVVSVIAVSASVAMFVAGVVRTASNPDGHRR